MAEIVNRIFTHKRFNLIAFGFIAGMVLLVYSNTFYSSFHFDDNPAIVDNQAIRRVTTDNLLTLLQGTRPVVNYSLLLNYQIGGLNVVGWHSFNISLHAVNSFFVYLLILWTLRLPALSARYGDRAARMALFGALLFAVHPVQTESVTYIISRTELLAAFFYLAAFLFFIKGATTRKFSHYIVSFSMSLLAMKSKEWAVTLPAVLMLYDFLFLSDGKWRVVLGRWSAYLLVALPWIFVAYTLSTGKLAGAGFGITGQNDITPWTYLLTSFNVLWTYIGVLFLPIKQNLDYEYSLAKTLFEFPTLLSLIGHICVVAISLWLYIRKRWTLIPFGAAWFYITLSPTQSFVPILDVIFEHRLYLPSIGFFIVFIAGVEGFMDWLREKTVFNSAKSVV